MKKILGAVLSGLLCAAIILGALYFDVIFAVVKDAFRGEIVLQNEEELYYYNRLGKDEKNAYKRIFNEIEEHPEEIRIPYLTEEQLVSVFEAVSYDQPEIACMSTSCTLTRKRNCYYFEAGYVYDKDKCQAHKEELRQKVDEILSGIDAGWSDYEKELYIHDYIIKGCTYTNDGSVDSYRAYGALINGQATCEGYARAMQILLNEVGIENFLMVGEAKNANGELQGHMWNVVKINGNYYHVDITWDDPIGQDEYSPSHVYFNLSGKDILINHYDLEKYDIVCESEEENFFIKNNMYFSAYDSNAQDRIKEEITAAVQNGKKRVEVRFANNEGLKTAEKALFEDKNIYSAIRDINEELDADKICNGISKGVNEKYNVIMIILSYGPKG